MHFVSDCALVFAPMTIFFEFWSRLWTPIVGLTTQVTRPFAEFLPHLLPMLPILHPLKQHVDKCPHLETLHPCAHVAHMRYGSSLENAMLCQPRWHGVPLGAVVVTSEMRRRASTRWWIWFPILIA